MDQNENQLRPIGICHKLFCFIMKTLAAQALKPVTLGPPIPSKQTQNPGFSGINPRVISHESGSGGSAEGPRGYESDASIDVEDVGSPLLEDEGGEVKVEVVGESTTGSKAPRKVVSIKDEPEVIYLSNKRRKTMADGQPSGLEREIDGELRPLRSILKVGSSSDLGSSNLREMQGQR